MKAYFDEEIRRCEALAQECAADDRGDEAVFARVEMNVYDIFRTVYDVAGKNTKNDGEKARFFETKLTQIPENWQTALEKANAHGDTEKAYIEGLKLETAARIRAKWEEMK